MSELTIRLGSGAQIKRLVTGWLMGGMLYIIGSAFYALGLSFGSDIAAICFLNLFAALSIFAFWKLQDWDGAKYQGFGAALLLFFMFYKLLNSADVLLYGNRLDDWPVTLPEYPSIYYLMYKGDVITQIGLFVLVSAWRMAIGSNMARQLFDIPGLRQGVQIPLILYAVGVLARIGSSFAGLDYGVMTNLFQFLYLLSIVSIYFVAQFASTAYRAFFYALMLGLPLSLLSLSTGMKEGIILPIIPIGIILLKAFRNPLSKALLLVSGIVVLGLSQLYVAHVRATAWASNEDIPTADLIKSFAEQVTMEDVKYSYDHVMRRINMMLTHTVTVGVYQRDGTYFKEIFGSIPATFIPRFLWPGKPINNPGALHTMRIQNFSTSFEDVKSSTASGFFTELYLGAGLFGLFIGSIAYGYLHAFIAKAFAAKLPPIALQLFCFLSFMFAIRMDEAAVAYAFNGLVFNAIFIYIIIFFLNRSGVKKSSAAMSGNIK